MNSKGWERVRTARLGESNASRSPEAAQLRQASSQTVRLCPVQPRPPSHRTIVCNYREANLLVRFKVLLKLKGQAQREGRILNEIQKSDTAAYEKGFNFNDDRIMRGAWRNERDPEICMEFFICLALCHTVLPEGDESLGKIVYQAASPDEAALVTAAKHFGFFFYRRTPTTLMLCESHVERMGNIQDVSYEILNVLEFNSTRKRQSVVCRYPNGRLVIYCKGADTVIYERMADASQDIKRFTREHSLVHQVY